MGQEATVVIRKLADDLAMKPGLLAGKVSYPLRARISIHPSRDTSPGTS